MKMNLNRLLLNKQLLRNIYELIVTQYVDMIGLGIMLAVFGGVWFNQIFN